MTERNSFVIRLTPEQARVLFNVIDGAADAGACDGGNTEQEAKALDEISSKLIAHRDKWKHVQLEPG